MTDTTIMSKLKHNSMVERRRKDSMEKIKRLEHYISKKIENSATETFKNGDDKTYVYLYKCISNKMVQESLMNWIREKYPDITCCAYKFGRNDCYSFMMHLNAVL